MPPKQSNLPNVWARVDQYFGDLLAPPDPALEAALSANRQAGLPAIDVTPLQGKFLAMLVQISGARRVLEIGALGGYSTIWLARALPNGCPTLATSLPLSLGWDSAPTTARAVPADPVLVSLELDPHHAKVARANLLNAGVLDRVDLRVAPAIETLKELVTGAAAPFDLIFIDADKTGYPDYLDWSLKLSRPGTLIVADNVVRDGRVIDPRNPDPNVQGVRRFTEKLAAEPRLSATVLQTVGSKGYDGFALAIVRG